MKKRRVRLSDQIRQAIITSGMSRYRICQEIGLAQSTISRFMAGKSGLSMDVLDQLADLIELNIATRKPSKRGRE